MHLTSASGRCTLPVTMTGRYMNSQHGHSSLACRAVIGLVFRAVRTTAQDMIITTVHFDSDQCWGINGVGDDSVVDVIVVAVIMTLRQLRR